MDRDNRWDRVEKAYNAIIEGNAKKEKNFIEAIKELSAKIETLEQENTALKARVTTLEG